MISPLTLLQYAASFAFLGWASYQDLKSREVRNATWLFYIIASVVLSTLNFTLFMPHAAVWYVINIAVTFILSMALWQLGVYGGADSKALICISIAHTVSLLTFAYAGVMLLTANVIQKRKEVLPAIPFLTLALGFSFIQVLMI